MVKTSPSNAEGSGSIPGLGVGSGSIPGLGVGSGSIPGLGVGSGSIPGLGVKILHAKKPKHKTETIFQQIQQRL